MITYKPTYNQSYIEAQDEYYYSPPEIKGYQRQFSIEEPRKIEEDVIEEEPIEENPIISREGIPTEEISSKETPKEEKSNNEWSDIKSIIKKNEGFIGTAKKLFNEPYYTVGYGFFDVLPDGTKITKDTKLTKEEADKQLDIAIEKLRTSIKKYSAKYNLTVSHEQENVLIDLGYHAGAYTIYKLFKEANGDSNKIGELLKTYATRAKYGDTSIASGLQARANRRAAGWNTLKVKNGAKLPKYQIPAESLPEYFGGYIEPVVKTAYAPDINTKQGSRAAQNMVRRIESGQDNTGSIPRKYSSYIHGELEGARPMTKAINDAGKPVGIGMAATFAAPWLIGAAASATASVPSLMSRPTVPALIKDFTGFELVDRLPTLFGQKRYTAMGGDLLDMGFRAGSQALDVKPETVEKVSPWVHAAGEIGTGFGVGSVSHQLGKALDKGMMGLSRAWDNYRTVRRSSSVNQATPELDALQNTKINPYSETGDTRLNLQRTEDKLASVPSDASSSGYTIEHLPQYQLRSLMRGNPLEKQLSKTGSISVNSIQALANKASNIEREVINKVLAEKFAGQKNIDYNQFRRAVQEELITYERSIDTRWDAYGLDKLGYNVEFDPALGIKYGTVLDEGVTPETFIFTSEQIPFGNNRHYDPSTLHHLRTFTDKKIPGKRFILEDQTDWGQRPIQRVVHSADGRTTFKSLEAFAEDIARRERKLRTTLFNRSDPKRRLEKDKALLERLKQHSSISPQEQYLHDNPAQRGISESLQLSAERGETSQLRPTPETAAKIEGYTKGRHIPYELQEDFEKMQHELSREINNIYEQYLPAGYLDDAYRVQSLPDDFLSTLSKENLSDLIWRSKVSEAFDTSPKRLELSRKISEVHEKWINDWYAKHGIVEDYAKEHKTILKKYADFPRIFKKLYGQEPRLYTDYKGNTWYEVDVPENYLDMEWRYKHGGKLKRRK